MPVASTKVSWARFLWNLIPFARGTVSEVETVRLEFNDVVWPAVRRRLALTGGRNCRQSVQRMRFLVHNPKIVVISAFVSAHRDLSLLS